MGRVGEGIALASAQKVMWRRTMGLHTHPTVVIPANYEVRQIAMVWARHLVIRHIAAAVGN